VSYFYRFQFRIQDRQRWYRQPDATQELCTDTVVIITILHKFTEVISKHDSYIK